MGQLGINNRASLKGLTFRAYFTARMNARSLKVRIRARVREHQEELGPIERTLIRTTSSMSSLAACFLHLRTHCFPEKKRDDHLSAAVKKREPAIQKLIKSYNAECDDIKDLIKRGRAPKKTRAPEPLPEKGVFKLDVDNPIWYDLGLDDASSTGAQPWLFDTKVRSGIRAMLLKNRCDEDSHRLLRERGHMQVWFARQWEAVVTSIEMADSGTSFSYFGIAVP